MEDLHPGSGRKLPSALESVTESEGLAAVTKALDAYEPASQVEPTPWLVFGSWTIFSDDTPPTDAALAALISALAELVKLSALEAERNAAKAAPRLIKQPVGFHELWSQAQSSPTYDKAKWVAFQDALEKLSAPPKEAP